MSKIDVVLAKSDLGVDIDGCDIGPSIIIDNINKDRINKIYEVNKPNVVKEKYGKKKNINYINDYNEKLYNVVLNSLNNDNFVLTIGGDHSTIISSSLANIKKYDNLGIIWVDAHGDFNTLKTTQTGNIHGLPLATVTNYEKELSNFHNGNFYSYKNTVIVGARDIDKEEYENIKDANIKIFSTNDIHKYGIDYVINEAIKIASKDVNGIYVSFDIDVIDPNIAKGVSVKAKDGITENEAYDILDNLLDSNLVKSIDVVEYNPINDDDKSTLPIVLNIVNKIIDKIC